MKARHIVRLHVVGSIRRGQAIELPKQLYLATVGYHQLNKVVFVQTEPNTCLLGVIGTVAVGVCYRRTNAEIAVAVGIHTHSQCIDLRVYIRTSGSCGAIGTVCDPVSGIYL